MPARSSTRADGRRIRASCEQGTLAGFDDVRELQKTLRSRGSSPDPAADESTTGPAYLMLTDPDGNPILIDQHVPSPRT